MTVHNLEFNLETVAVMRFQLGTFWSGGQRCTKQSTATTLSDQKGDESLPFSRASPGLSGWCLTHEAERAFTAALALETHNPKP